MDLVCALDDSIQLLMKIFVGEMHVLCGGKQLKMTKGFGDYGIISIVAVLKGGFRGNGASSETNSRSFKDTLNPYPNP